jgi:hypothetical protein
VIGLGPDLFWGLREDEKIKGTKNNANARIIIVPRTLNELSPAINNWTFSKRK